MTDAEVIQVIRTRLLRRGEGTEENPIRVVEQFWALDGTLLAENDSLRPVCVERGFSHEGRS